MARTTILVKNVAGNVIQAGSVYSTPSGSNLDLFIEVTNIDTVTRDVKVHVKTNGTDAILPLQITLAPQEKQVLTGTIPGSKVISGITVSITSEVYIPPPPQPLYNVDCSFDKTSFPENTYVTITMKVTDKKTGSPVSGINIWPAFDGQDPSGTPAFPGATDSTGTLIIKTLGIDYGGKLLYGSHDFQAVVLSNISNIPHSWSNIVSYIAQPPINYKLQWTIKDSKGNVVPSASCELLVYFGQYFYNAILTSDATGYVSWQIPTGFTCNNPYPNGSLTVKENSQVWENQKVRIASPCGIQVITCLAKSEVQVIKINGSDAKANLIKMPQGRNSFIVEVTGMRPGALAVITLKDPTGNIDNSFFVSYARYPYQQSYKVAQVDDSGKATFPMVSFTPWDKSLFATNSIPVYGSWQILVEDIGFIYDSAGGVWSPSLGTFSDYLNANTNAIGAKGPSISTTFMFDDGLYAGLPARAITLPQKQVTVNGQSFFAVVAKYPQLDQYNSPIPNPAAITFDMKGYFPSVDYTLVLYDPTRKEVESIYPGFFGAYLVHMAYFKSGVLGDANFGFGLDYTYNPKPVIKKFIDGQSGWDSVYWLVVELRDYIDKTKSTIPLQDPPTDTNYALPGKYVMQTGSYIVAAYRCIFQ